MKKSFQDIWKLRKEKSKKLLSIKGVEYATDNQRYSNFYKASLISGQNSNKCLLFFALKHFTSLYDFLKGSMLKDYFEEKISDAICYCILYIGLTKNLKLLDPTIEKLRPKEIKLNNLQDYYFNTLQLLYKYDNLELISSLLNILCTIDYLFSAEQCNT